MSGYVGRHRLEDLYYASHFHVTPAEDTPDTFPGKHATTHDQAIAIANASIQVARSIPPLELPPLPPRARRRRWWF